jgi:hypothetical protein
LYTLNKHFVPIDSIKVNSPVSQIRHMDKHNLQLLMMGIMDPNDQARGQLASLNVLNKTVTVLIDSLQRPVNVTAADLNNDQWQDYVISSFGNYTGDLSLFQGTPQGTFRKKVLSYLPGARHTIVNDLDNNGYPDVIALLTQGNEQIQILYNQGNMNFRQVVALKFPPVYGSSYFELADFNNDGKADILYTNGDNADYSPILKPYHGVRIFRNDGRNHFIETWSYPMHGASKAIARDFDQDGDLDIAAISFFPDFKHAPEQSFIYFENTGADFKPFITPLAKEGRWMIMEAFDVDADGDDDILLGAMNFFDYVPDSLIAFWKSKQTSLLLLRNNTK